MTGRRMILRSPFRLLVTVLLALPLTGCLFRSHRAQVLLSNQPLKTASLEQLVATVNDQAGRIRTLNASVDLAASSGGSKKGKITEYKEIKGYILVRQPGMLRMIGLLPIVRNRAFDMVSDGNSFKLWIPPENKFVVGSNQVVHPSRKALENLRPQHIYDALLLHPIDASHDIAVVEHSNRTVQDPKTKKQVLEPDYNVDVITRSDKDWYLSRRITFSRVDLMPVRQRVYDRNGYLATDATYFDFKDYSGVMFPSVIRVWRPQEEYSVTVIIEKLKANQPLTDEQFVLEQPPGSQLVQLDNPAPTAASNHGGAQPH
jgi:outer membrane lipoprotein-sorting protein